MQNVGVLVQSEGLGYDVQRLGFVTKGCLMNTIVFTSCI